MVYINKKLQYCNFCIYCSFKNFIVHLNCYIIFNIYFIRLFIFIKGATETVCGNPALFLRSRKQELKNENTDKSKVIEIKNYINKFENDENNIKSENEEENKDLNDRNNKIPDKSIAYDTNKKGLLEISNIYKERKNDHKDHVPIIGKYDLLHDKINNKKKNISNLCEKKIKEKIDKTIVNEYEKKKSKKIRHQRSKSSISTSQTSNIISSSIISNENNIIQSINNININNNNNKKELKIKPLLLHKRSSAIESELNRYLYSNSENSEDQLHSGMDVFITFPKNTLKKTYYISKKYNKINLPYCAIDNLCDLEKKNKRNVIIRKVNIKNNTNDFDDLAFISNKKDNVLIPHPPLEPIPIQDNCQRPTSVPLIRRKMYRKK